MRVAFPAMVLGKFAKNEAKKFNQIMKKVKKDVDNDRRYSDWLELLEPNSNVPKPEAQEAVLRRMSGHG